MNTPLNRRGSRSEGRINIQVQDRLAEAERLKKETTLLQQQPQIPQKEQPPTISKGIAGLPGVTLISNDSNCVNTKEKLGIAGRGLSRQIGDFRPRTADLTKNNSYNINERANSVDKCYSLNNKLNHEIISTKFLTDSSTITIPITKPTLNSAGQPIPGGMNIPKLYKTMPSPTKTSSATNTANFLNEIFEEGTDIGSSDNSATTTPKLITRQQHFTSNRTITTKITTIASSSSSSMTTGSATTSSSSTTTTTTQRRSKFHKTRTASCSSSDASDDDSENRKKRNANKIIDFTKPQPQRRDSYDDSSDSQDPGNNTGGGCSSSSNNNNAAQSLTMTTVQEQEKQQKTAPTNNHQDTSKSSTTSDNNSSRQKSMQPMGFRRHRTGRRRAGETRLRESQSLNRITEVQESEIPLLSLVQKEQNVPTPPSVISKPKGFSARLFHGFRKSETNTTNTSTTAVATATSTNNSIDSSSKLKETNLIPPIAVHEDDDVEMVLGAELAKALRVTETQQQTTKSSSTTTKKLKILGKYFQVRLKMRGGDI